MLEDTSIGTKTSDFIRSLGVKSFNELASLEVIRGPEYIIQELRYSFFELGIEFNGRFETRESDIPEHRLVPRLDVTFMQTFQSSPNCRIGGEPSESFFTFPWPNCAECHQPMNFVGQLVGPLRVSGVEILRNEAVQMFSCFNADSGCRAWDPNSGANAAHVSACIDRTPRRSSTAPFPAYDLLFKEGYDDNIIRQSELTPSDEDEYYEAFLHAQNNKLGGLTATGNGFIAPCCDDCHKPMVLLAQFSSEAVPNPFGDGFCFVHICPLKHQAKIEYMRSG